MVNGIKSRAKIMRAMIAISSVAEIQKEQLVTRIVCLNIMLLL